MALRDFLDDPSGWVSDDKVLFRDRIAGGAESFANNPIGVEVNLPVVIRVTIGTHGEHRAVQVEFEDLHIRRRIGDHVGNFGEPLFEQLDRFVVVHGVGQLGLQVDAPERVMREILNGVAENFAVADEIHNIVQRIDRGDEKADFLDGAGDAAGGDEVADLERSQDHDKCAGGEVRQQAAPRHADRHAGGSDDGGEAGGLDAEVAENRDYKNDIQGHRNDRADVTQQRRIDFLLLHRGGDQVHGKADEPAADQPEDQRANDFEADHDSDIDDCLHGFA